MYVQPTNLCSSQFPSISSGEIVVNRFRSAYSSGDFLVTAEVSPPKGGDPSKMVKLATKIFPWVHAVNITDGSRSVMRMSSLAASSILLDHGVEPIYQLTCRDRNIIALQADLLGAHALGIRNVLALTGDPVKAGDHPNAKSVFDLESVRLIHGIQYLNRGYALNNKPLDNNSSTAFLVGAAVDPQIRSWSSLQRRFERKVSAGADFFQSQLITDFDRFELFMTKIAKPAGKPVLAGIFLLKSAKNARFINRVVPGVEIPEYLIHRLEQATDPLKEGMLIAAEQVQIAKQLCQGVHIMTINREDLIPEILRLSGIKPVKSFLVDSAA
jgi:methylenetetrahydrofolate reductase (NADPH)